MSKEEGRNTAENTKKRIGNSMRGKKRQGEGRKQETK